jgi:TPR repeat protein
MPRVVHVLWIASVFLGHLGAAEAASQIVRVSKLSALELAAVRERALGGDTDSQVILGRAYGGANLTVKADQAEARRWYEIPAKQGNLDARFWLAGLNHAQTKDARAARKTYLELAEAGHVGGMNAFADYCAAGIGGPQDYAAAMPWWKKAAPQSAEAAFNVGIMYLNGEGVAADEDAAAA